MVTSSMEVGVDHGKNANSRGGVDLLEAFGREASRILCQEVHLSEPLLGVLRAMPRRATGGPSHWGMTYDDREK